MKKSKIPFAFLVLITLISCDKDPEQIGCTDHLAVNYDARALEDDGSCTYNQAEQMVWSNGQFGGWNADLQEGAYRLESCSGEIAEIIEIQTQETSDSTETTEEFRSLYLGTGAETLHRSYFSLINERNARDFAEGTLRFDCRRTDEAPEFIRIFISGKLIQNDACNPYRRSEFVDIATRSFNDSTYTQVAIPMRNFGQIMMAHVEVVCGIEFEGERSTGIEINNIRWSANRDQ
jgi:hypothetical protein